jgi:hypothetical protein
LVAVFVTVYSDRTSGESMLETGMKTERENPSAGCRKDARLHSRVR